jgi:hypothetical protein
MFGSSSKTQMSCLPKPVQLSAYYNPQQLQGLFCNLLLGPILLHNLWLGPILPRNLWLGAVLLRNLLLVSLRHTLFLRPLICPVLPRDVVDDYNLYQCPHTLRLLPNA